MTHLEDHRDYQADQRRRRENASASRGIVPESYIHFLRNGIDLLARRVELLDPDDISKAQRARLLSRAEAAKTCWFPDELKQIRENLLRHLELTGGAKG